MRAVLRYALRGLLALLAALAVVALLNMSFWSSYRAPLTLLAHRGLAQTFPREGLTNDTCTAARIDPPETPYLENTVASMRASFAAGADIVEFDIHPTTDGAFAVFHDWTVDCRTEGTGITRTHTLVELQRLDIGYGYTADGGKTFPVRGKGVGLMPSLDEVLTTFPTKRFLINIKSNDPHEGDLLADRLLQLPAEQRALLMAYGGGDRPIVRLHERIPELRTASRKSLLACATRYIALGWSGRVPAQCHNALVLVPENAGWLFWGWPNLFFERMHNAGSEVFVIGPYEPGDIGTSGIDTKENVEALPTSFSGGVWTNRIDHVAHLFGREGNPISP